MLKATTILRFNLFLSSLLIKFILKNVLKSIRTFGRVYLGSFKGVKTSLFAET